ncbi:thermonuclease family protein [uncultured Tateyamaria sp.]|uniref:thermonuclease family protein n=1 Tax=Tateyamaria sp. 1078 TaxID=3417464 RepID=UPI00263552DC|nr:thermonuclease family protein [uncultured Tateyamaria sp.]
MEPLFLLLFGGVAIWVVFGLGKKRSKPRVPLNPQASSVRLSRPTPKPRKKVEHDPPPPIPQSMRLKGKAWVIDGDTIVINKVKIRLAGIDAPELDQHWGQKSKWEMVRLCKGEIISVELTGETSYDRLVGTCFLPDCRDVGAEIVKAGLALDGGHFSKGKYKHLENPDMRRKLRGYGRWR